MTPEKFAQEHLSWRGAARLAAHPIDGKSWDECRLDGDVPDGKLVYAVKFTPEYGLIRVTIQPGAEGIRVAVTNTGSTIPPEKKDRIFQKFYQADKSHATQGNGVGLAIVKKVVELHHGQVNVSCDENSTTFTVVLPA
jgi:signal transduction histidine kinase